MHAAFAADNEDVETLGEVVISATKTEQSSSDAPASVSVMSAKKIEKMDIHSADEALKFTPGAYTKRAAGHEPSVMGTNVVLRGIPDYSRTLVVVDGQTLNDPYIGAVTWESVPPETIQRIEVVPGPFSSLYGGSAMAGVINIITKVPTKREFSYKNGFGTDHFTSESFVYQNRPLEWLAVAFDYGKKRSEGFVKDEVLVGRTTTGTPDGTVTGARQTTDASGNLRYLIGDKGPVGWTSNTIGAKFYVDLSANSRLGLGVSRFKYGSFGRNQYNTYLRDAAGNPVSSGLYTVSGSGNNITVREKDFLTGPDTDIKTQDRYTMEYERQLESATLKATVAHIDIPLYNNYIVLGNTATLANGGTATRMLRPNKESSGSLQLSMPVSDSNLLVTGISAGKRDIYTVTYNISDWREDMSTGPVANQTGGYDKYYAVYAQDELKLSEKLTAYLGARYDSWTTQGYIESSATGRATYDARSQSHVSPKASLVYRPQEQTTLRASVGSAFHTPLLRDTFGWWTPMNGYIYIPNPDLKPETVTSWELGVEQQVGSGTLLRATYYENNLKDLIYRTQVDYAVPDVNGKVGEQSVANAGEAKVKGIELEARQKLTDGLSAFVNVTFNNSRITSNPAKVLTEGKRMTNTPSKMANIGIMGEMGAWSGSLGGHYVGKVYANDENKDYVNGVFGSYDPFFTTNAKVAYSVKNLVKLSLSVNNLGDRKYYQSTLEQGRAYFAEVELKF
jgi:iron complex outermembrane receptor protein